MAVDTELVVDGGMNREELLRRAGRSKASTLSFPLPGWLVRNLGPFVRAPAGDMSIGQIILLTAEGTGTCAIMAASRVLRTAL